MPKIEIFIRNGDYDAIQQMMVDRDMNLSMATVTFYTEKGWNMAYEQEEE